MDYKKFADKKTAMNPELIKFDEQVYMLSALTDLLRDNTKDLLTLRKDTKELSEDMLGVLQNRYLNLRKEVLTLLQNDPAAVNMVNQWTSDAALVSGEALFDAASSLARVLDVIIQTPAFVTSRVSQRGEIQNIISRLDEEDEGDKGTSSTPKAAGQYL